MKLKGKILGLAAATLMTLGVSGSAFAADNSSITTTYTINAGTDFSVVIDSATSIQSKTFTLGDSSPQYSNTYYYTVTDMRGTGDGWTVKSSSAGFGTDPVDGPFIPGQQIHVTNLYWQTTDGLNHSNLDPNAITNGIGGKSNWTNILVPGGAQVLRATPGVVDFKPNGTGVFHAADTLYINFPFGVAAGTYQATVTLTLSSGNQP
jgi:hypothetical protein